MRSPSHDGIRTGCPPVRLLLLIAGLGCAGKPTALEPAPTSAPNRCLLGDQPHRGRDTLFVAGTDTGLIRRARFETMIRLDCDSQTQPGLAQSWSGDSGGLNWTFVLRDSAATAPEVVAQWQAGAALQVAGVQSAVPLDARRLVVTMSEPYRSVPDLFADSSLAAGSDVRPVRSLTIVPVNARDPRDALDGPADLVLTDDPGVLAYAASRPDFLTRPLPWSRTYVLLLPGELTDLGSVADSLSFRAALARDAVRADARGATSPSWWIDSLSCPAAPHPSVTAAASLDRTIAYPRDDRIARALAERIVALAKPGLGSRALDPGAFALALRRGAGAGFVLPLPRQALVPCRERARWPAGAAILPLVDTRMTAIVRRGAPALEVQWDGTLRLPETMAGP